MHYGFVLKCRAPDGRADYIPAQVLAGSRKEAAKRLLAEFERDNIYAPGFAASSGCTKMIFDVLLDCGESEEGWENSQKLYDKACKKAERLASGERSGEAGKEDGDEVRAG